MRCTRETTWNCAALGASVSGTARHGKDATHVRVTRFRFPPRRSHHLAPEKPSKRQCNLAQHLQRVPTVLLPTGQRWSGEASVRRGQTHAMLHTGAFAT